MMICCVVEKREREDRYGDMLCTGEKGENIHDDMLCSADERDRRHL